MCQTFRPVRMLLQLLPKEGRFRVVECVWAGLLVTLSGKTKCPAPSYPGDYLQANPRQSPLSPSRSPCLKDKTDHRTIGL